MNRKQAPELIPFKPEIPANPRSVSVVPGIPLFIFPDETTDIFYFGIYTKAGHRSILHPLIPHLTGAMLSEGTANYNSSELAETIDYYGAFFQQETGRDVASIHMYVPARHATPVIDLAFEIFTSPAFPKNRMQLQIRQKKQQYVIDRKKVKVLAAEAFFRNLFGSDHPYGLSIKTEDFKGISTEQLVNFHNRFYTVKNSYFIAAGNVSKSNIDMIREIFGFRTSEGRKPTDEKYRLKEMKEKNVYVQVENAVQSAIRIGFPTIKKTHKDYPLFQLLTTILGGYFGSRLMRNIREEKGYTYGIGAGLVSFFDSGYFSISSEVGSDVCNAAINEVYKEIEILKKKKVGEQELTMVKNYLSGEFIRMFDGFSQTSPTWRAAYDFGMDFSFFRHYHKTIMNATPAQLYDIANRYFIRENFHEIVAGKR